MYITLRCINCEQLKCGLARKWIPYNSKEGCTRQVDDEIAARYQHYIQEVIPFWKNYDMNYVRQSYNEIMNFLEKDIYSATIGQKLDYYGKVKMLKK